MNKKEIAAFRRQFKLESEQLTIDTIFNVYVQKESADIYHHVSQPFGLLDKESQELFLVNFKKVLTGQLDSKLFELKFNRDIEDNTQSDLFEALHTKDTENWEDSMLQIVDKMFSHTVYDFDTVVTFIKGQYRKPTKQRDFNPDEDGTDSVYANTFILCSLNKTSQPQKSLVFDYIEKAFRANRDVDPIINLTTPLTGFLFPTITDDAQDVNHVLYNAGKPNQPDEVFIEDVLNCEVITTAGEDKDCFELIVNNIAEDKVNSDMISRIYDEIDHRVQASAEDEEEDPIINYRDVENILTSSGLDNVDTEKVKSAFKSIIDDEQHTFKAQNLMPKTIKIETEVAKLSIKPEHLKNIKYITHDGKRCLLLEINEDVVIEGFQLDAPTDN